MYTEVDRPLSLFGSTYSIQSMKATALDSKRKRSRNSGPCLNPSNNDAPDLECARLWVEKYKPQLVDDLVMAPKKVAEIRQWLLSFSSSSNGPKLLILTGGPGIGKSTTVVLLAKELGLQILQWTHNNNMTSAGKTRVLDDRIGVVEEDRIHRSSNGILHQTSKGSTYTPRRPMEEQYQGTTLNLGLGNFETFQNYEDLHSNQLSSLDSFLQSASLGYTSVILEPDMESTWIQSKQLVNSRTSDHYKKNKQDKTKNPKENIKNSSVDDIISDGDDDGIHARPTKQRGPGVSSFSSVPTHMLHLSKNRPGPSYSSIILLEELPTLNTEEREEQFRYGFFYFTTLSIYLTAPCLTL
jgi:DNA polymerase III delta prime subunit